MQARAGSREATRRLADGTVIMGAMSGDPVGALERLARDVAAGDAVSASMPLGGDAVAAVIAPSGGRLRRKDTKALAGKVYAKGVGELLRALINNVAPHAVAALEAEASAGKGGIGPAEMPGRAGRFAGLLAGVPNLLGGTLRFNDDSILVNIWEAHHQVLLRLEKEGGEGGIGGERYYELLAKQLISIVAHESLHPRREDGGAHGKQFEQEANLLAVKMMSAFARGWGGSAMAADYLKRYIEADPGGARALHEDYVALRRAAGGDDAEAAGGRGEHVDDAEHRAAGRAPRGGPGAAAPGAPAGAGRRADLGVGQGSAAAGAGPARDGRGVPGGAGRPEQELADEISADDFGSELANAVRFGVPEDEAPALRAAARRLYGTEQVPEILDWAARALLEEDPAFGYPGRERSRTQASPWVRIETSARPRRGGRSGRRTQASPWVRIETPRKDTP
jgi:hypothetical protein